MLKPVEGLVAVVELTAVDVIRAGFVIADLRLSVIFVVMEMQLLVVVKAAVLWLSLL